MLCASNRTFENILELSRTMSKVREDERTLMKVKEHSGNRKNFVEVCRRFENIVPLTSMYMPRLHWNEPALSRIFDGEINNLFTCNLTYIYRD